MMSYIGCAHGRERFLGGLAGWICEDSEFPGVLGALEFIEPNRRIVADCHALVYACLGARLRYAAVPRVGWLSIRRRRLSKSVVSPVIPSRLTSRPSRHLQSVSPIRGICRYVGEITHAMSALTWRGRVATDGANPPPSFLRLSDTRLSSVCADEARAWEVEACLPRLGSSRETFVEQPGPHDRRQIAMRARQYCILGMQLPTGLQRT